MSALDGLERERDREVRLADAARSEEQDVLALMQGAERGELGDGVPGYLRLGVEVERLEGLRSRQAAELEVGADPALEPGSELDAHELIEHFNGELLGFLSALQDRIERAERTGSGPRGP
jgi:hypothetical protein